MIILQDKIPLEVLQRAYETSICQNLLNVFKDEVENCREAALDLVFELVVGPCRLIYTDDSKDHSFDTQLSRVS